MKHIKHRISDERKLWDAQRKLLTQQWTSEIDIVIREIEVGEYIANAIGPGGLTREWRFTAPDANAARRMAWTFGIYTWGRDAKCRVR